MAKKLYAGLIMGNFEYAMWADNWEDLANQFKMPVADVRERFVNCSANKNLKPLIPDKTKIYRTSLLTDEADWRVWRAIM